LKKDVTKQLEMLGNISQRPFLYIPIRHGEDNTLWIIHSRTHKDMISFQWRITDTTLKAVVAFPRAHDVIEFLTERYNIKKEEIEEEIEYVVSSHINNVTTAMKDIKEIYSDEDVEELYELECAKNEMFMESLTEAIEGVLGRPEDTKPKLTIVEEQDD